MLPFHVVRPRALSLRLLQALSLSVALGTATAAMAVAPVGADANIHAFHISAGPLAEALHQFIAQSGLQVLYDPALVEGHTAARIDSVTTPRAVLDALLKDTGITYEFTDSGTVVIKRNPSATTLRGTKEKKQPAGSTKSIRELGTVQVIGHISALSATRADTPIREIPQTVAVISQDTLAQQNATDLASALMQQPGLQLVSDNSQDWAVYSRGFLINAVHIDGGAPIGLVGGSVDVTSRDLAQYTSIDILQGSDALFGGSGNPGGTINLARKEPTPYLLGSASLSLGSWDQRRLVGDISGPITSKLSGRAVASFEKQNYFYDTANDKHRMFYGVLKYEFTPSTSISVGGSYERDHATNNFSGLPWYDDGRKPPLSRSLALTVPWAYDENTFTEAFTTFKHDFNSNWKMTAHATYLKEQMPHDVSVSFQGPINSDTDLLNSVAAQKSRQLGFHVSSGPFTNVQKMADVTITGKFTWLGHLQHVMLGADYEQQQSSSDVHSFKNFGAAIDPFAFDTSLYPEPDLSPNLATSAVPTRNTTIQWGAYGSFRFVPVDHLAFTLGGRLSTYRATFNTALVLPALGKTLMNTTIPVEYHNVFTPYGGVTYDLGKHFTAYASYAIIYRTNAGAVTAAQAPLAASNGITKEVGIKGAWFNNLLNGSIAAFDTVQDGIAVPDPSAPISLANPTCCYLTGSLRSKGVQTSVTGRLSPRWTITAGYTYADSVLSSPSRVARLPKNTFKLWTNYQLPGGHLSVGGGFRALSANRVSQQYCASGARPCTTFISFGQGFYTVTDLRVAYHINPNWDVALNVNNVFDKSYFQTLGQLQSGNWYGAPRNFMLNLTGRIP